MVNNVEIHSKDNSQKRTLITNLSFLMTSHFIVTMASLITVSLIGRYFGSTTLGQYSFLLSFTEIFVWISDFGLATLITKKISENRKKSIENTFSNFFCTKIIFLTISFVAFLGIILLFYSTDKNMMKYLFFFQIYVLFNSLITFLRAVLRGFEIMKYEPIIDSLEKVISISIIFLIISFGFSFFEIILAFMFTSLLSLSIFLFLVLKKVNLSFSEFSNIRSKMVIIKEAIPFAMNSIVAIIYFKIGIILISLILGDEQAGIFYAGYGLILTLAFLPVPISSASFPRLSFDFHNNFQDFYSTSSFIVRIILIIGFPIAIGLIVVSNDVIFLLFGSGFQESIPVIIIAAIYLPFRYIDTQFGTMLSACGHQSKRTIIVTICAVITFISSFILISNIGIIGAVFSLLISEILMFIMFLITIWYVFEWIPSFRETTLKPLIAASLMGILCVIIQKIGFFFVVGSGVLSYFIVLYLIGGITKDDLVSITSIIKPKKKV